MDTWKTNPIYLLLQPLEAFTGSFKYSSATEEDLVINLDVLRTRVGEIDEQVQGAMKNIIKFYCQQMKIQYKQGLNEVLAPFMDLYKQGMPLNITLACFENFVNRVLPNFFSDQVLYN